MILVLEIIALASLSPLLGGAFLLVKGAFERNGHKYNIDDYFEQKEQELSDVATLMHSRLDTLDEFAALMRPELLIDDAVGTEMERRMQPKYRPASRRMTV